MQFAPIEDDSHENLLHSVNLEGEKEAQFVENKLSELWKYTLYRYNLIICIFLWVICSYGYYSLTYVLKYLGGDIFVNAYTSALAEVIAKLSVSALVLHTGLKRLFILAFGLGTIGTLLLCFSSQSSGSYVAVSVFIAKFGFSQAFPANYVAVLLLFPTVLNATTMGICNFFTRLITILAPLFVELTPPIPMVIVTVSGVLAIILSQFLQETK